MYEYNRYGEIMKSILVEMTCPTCSYHTHIPSDTVIIPEFEPDLKKRLQQGTFYSYVCPCCHTKIHFFHTCIYPDKEHGFVLMMKTKKERQFYDHSFYENKGFVRRYIGSEDAIAEKINILEGMFDDRVIEIMKVKLYLHFLKQGRKIASIRYHDYEQGSFWFCIQEDEQPQLVAINKADYDDIKTTLKDIVTEQFEEIDLNWAIEYLKKV